MEGQCTTNVARVFEDVFAGALLVAIGARAIGLKGVPLPEQAVSAAMARRAVARIVDVRIS